MYDWDEPNIAVCFSEANEYIIHVNFMNPFEEAKEFCFESGNPKFLTIDVTEKLIQPYETV